MVEPIFDYQFRFILIGDTTVGKSTLLKAFTESKFFEESDPTVGVDFFARLVEVKNGVRVKLQLWDTAGQERFRSITRSYYRNSVGVILLYDITSRKSYEHLTDWLLEVRRHIEAHKAVFMIIGCKADLEEERQVTHEEGKSFADYHQVHFFETSAKTNFNVEDCFLQMTQDVYDKILSEDFKVEDGWEGIKNGFVRPLSNNTLLEGEPAKSFCC